MAPQKRTFRPPNRISGVRDARLILIAAEGQATEKVYFEALASVHRNPRVHVAVIEQLETASSPQHIEQQMDGLRAEYRFQPGYDELWLVIDVDRWRERTLSEVAERCGQKYYRLAVSNPCFEVWLLLHVRDLPNDPPEIRQALLENRKEGSRTRVEQELLAALGRYNKSRPEMVRFLPHVTLAIQRARALDVHPQHRWPNDLGTRVYLLAERIIA